jgi:nicotinate-nucleotide adenylyltransferase
MALAQAAIEQLQLDALHIIPTGSAWHKDRTLSDPAHRLEMCRLAFADIACAVINDCETLRSGPSYTMDTLEHLRSQFLLVGQDQAMHLSEWHRAKEIPGLAIITVASRSLSVDAVSTVGNENDALFAIKRLEMPAMPQSSTQIRSCVQHNTRIDSLVCEPVARYIANHQLYRMAR